MGDSMGCMGCEQLEDARAYAKMLQQQMTALKKEVQALNNKLSQQPQQPPQQKTKVAKKKNNKDVFDEGAELLALRLKVKELDALKRENEGLRKQLEVETDLRKRAEKELKTNRENLFLALQIAQLQGYCSKE